MPETLEVETPEQETEQETKQEPTQNLPPKERNLPDYVGDDHNACAWIAHTNPNGEIVSFNVKIGGFRFKLRKRFL